MATREHRRAASADLIGQFWHVKSKEGWLLAILPYYADKTEQNVVELVNNASSGVRRGWARGVMFHNEGKLK